MPKILFVCTGNICRSSGAEAVLRHEVKKAGLIEEFKIDSAGTHGYHIGEAPDPRGIKAAKKRGISMEGQRARQVMSDDFHQFDYIIAMDHGHRQILENLMPNNTQAKLNMFADYCSEHKIQDVPDPYYGDLDGFETVLDILEDGVKGIFDKV